MWGHLTRVDLKIRRFWMTDILADMCFFSWIFRMYMFCILWDFQDLATVKSLDIYFTTLTFLYLLWRNKIWLADTNMFHQVNNKNNTIQFYSYFSSSSVFILKRTLSLFANNDEVAIPPPFGPTYQSSAWHSFRTGFKFSFWSLFAWPDYYLLPGAHVGGRTQSWWATAP